MSNGCVKARADCSRAAGHCEQEVPTVSDGMSSVAQNAARVMPERYADAIVAGLDVHLRQITFDCLDSNDRGNHAREDHGDPGSSPGMGRVVAQGAVGGGAAARIMDRAGAHPSVAFAAARAQRR